MLATFCKQPSTPALRKLERGSVIAFGAAKPSRGAFLLDTVFVVADTVDHDRRNYREHLGTHLTALAAALTLHPRYQLGVRGPFRALFGATPTMRSTACSASSPACR
jgi:hypothetical protein